MNKEAKLITKLAQMKSKGNQITQHDKDKLRGIGFFYPKEIPRNSHSRKE